MSDSSFLDTNVFVYSFDQGEPAKRARAMELIARALRTGDGLVSYQVVQEFLSVALQKFAAPLGLEECRSYLGAVMMPLCRVFPTAELYSKALHVRGAAGLAFYDALIVAGAVLAGCSRVLSEDMQDGRVIEGVRIENPFAVR